MILSSDVNYELRACLGTPFLIIPPTDPECAQAVNYGGSPPTDPQASAGLADHEMNKFRL